MHAFVRQKDGGQTYTFLVASPRWH